MNKLQKLEHRLLWILLDRWVMRKQNNKLKNSSMILFLKHNKIQVELWEQKRK